MKNMDNESQELMRSTILLNSFWKMQKNVMQFVQKTASNNDLSVPQYSILMTMTHFDNMTQKAVGEKTFLPKSTLSQAVDGLVQSGLLNRHQLESNRREMQLSISEQGKTLIKAIHFQKDGIHQVFHNAIEQLTEKQYQELIQTHIQITTYLEEQKE